MIAGSEHLPFIEVGRLATRRARPQALRAPAGALCAAAGFVCFLPYPALGVGNATAVQMGNVAVLALCLPAAFMAWRGRPFWVFPLLVAPLCVATAKAALAGQDGLDVSFKALAVWGVSCAAVLATQVAAPRHGLQLLVGVAAATLLHAAVGLLQVHGFSRGELPLEWLYVNPSFLSVQDNAETIARYIQRPFGLFPEPSAMSSSLAPWVLLMFAVTCGAVRLRQRVLPWQRWLFLAASLGGLGLIIVSRSGHAAVTAAAFVGLLASWLVRARATPRTVSALLAGLGVFLPVVLYLAAVSVGGRLGGKSELGNSSWGDRADSLRIGFACFAESGAATHVFGMGVGQASPTLQASAGLDAVWSVLLTYVFETGLVGALALVVVGHLMARVWAAARYDLVFAAVALVWLVGITLTTSYDQLLPIWMTLGLLTVWPEVCEAPVGARGRGAA
jgi:hypothetical protein